MSQNTIPDASLETDSTKPFLESSYAGSFAPQDEREVSPPPQRMSGQRSDIALNSALLALPLLFSAVLLGVVFHYRVKHNSAVSDDFQLPGTVDEPGVYYVNFEATRLFFIASWSSSLAPLLLTSAMTLASYPIAQSNLRNAQANASAHLFTPYQLALALRMLNGGGFSVLWDWSKYVLWWKKRHTIQARALVHVSTLLWTMTFLGFVVFLADTWLHITTKAVDFTNIEGINIGYHSFGLIRRCTTSDNSLDSQRSSTLDVSDNSSPCSIEDGGYNGLELLSREAPFVLNNVSDFAAAATYDVGPVVYLGVPVQPGLAQQDYTASTFGMMTQCSFINSEQCDRHRVSGCRATLSFTSPFHVGFFSNGTMSSTDTNAGVSNPYFFGLAAVVSIGANFSDPAFMSPTPYGTSGGTSFAMFCNSSMYDIVYSSINGTVSRFETQLSNTSVTNIAQLTSSAGINATTITPGYTFLMSAASLATLSQTTTQWTDQIALAYSRVAMSYFAGSVVALPALQAQKRTTFIVSRIPTAPLWSLIVANMLFVVIGFMLTTFAIMALDDENKDVQVRLSIAGLVADRFESSRARRDVKEKEDLFEEKSGGDSVRIGIVKAGEGGYIYSVVRSG